jgi:hypothetical protein
LEYNSILFKTLGAQPFNYTDAIDALPNSINVFAGPTETAGTGGFINSSGLFQMAGAGDVSVTGQWGQASATVAGTDPKVTTGTQSTNYADTFGQTDGTNSITATGSSVSDAGAFVLAETALDMHCWGENPVITAKLQLNGQDRFSEREGSYFDVVQPWQHHTRSPDSGINVYSFALKPEDHQPSGTCNFSRIDNATLQLVLSAGAVAGTSTAKGRVYAVNYNVLRVMSGMAGIAYSN